MKLNITILEDTEAHKRCLERVIQDAAKKIKVTVGLFAVSTGLDINEKTVLQTDLFFLDVQTPHRTGIETAKFIRTVSSNVPIVFTTNFENYALKGYEVHAFQFLLKPVTVKDCIPCLQTAMDYVKQREQESVMLMLPKAPRIIPHRNILYVEADNHICKIVCDDETLSYRTNLTEIAKELPAHTFQQCQRSFLVNISRITAVNRQKIVLDNCETIPVSDTYFADIEKAFVDRLLAEGGRWS